jgi:hypothetical protein
VKPGGWDERRLFREQAAPGRTPDAIGFLYDRRFIHGQQGAVAHQPEEIATRQIFRGPQAALFLHSSHLASDLNQVDNNQAPSCLCDEEVPSISQDHHAGITCPACRHTRGFLMVDDAWTDRDAEGSPPHTLGVPSGCPRYSHIFTINISTCADGHIGFLPCRSRVGQ